MLCISGRERLIGCRFAAWCRLPLERIGRLLEKAHLIFQLHAHLRSGNQILALLETRIALGFDFIVDRPVGQTIRINYGADLAQFGLPFGGKFPIDFSTHAVSAEKHRPWDRAFFRWWHHLL